MTREKSLDLEERVQKIISAVFSQNRELKEKVEDLTEQVAAKEEYLGKYRQAGMQLKQQRDTALESLMMEKQGTAMLKKANSVLQSKNIALETELNLIKFQTGAIRRKHEVQARLGK